MFHRYIEEHTSDNYVIRNDNNEVEVYVDIDDIDLEDNVRYRKKKSLCTNVQPSTFVIEVMSNSELYTL